MVQLKWSYLYVRSGPSLFLFKGEDKAAPAAAPTLTSLAAATLAVASRVVFPVASCRRHISKETD